MHWPSRNRIEAQSRPFNDAMVCTSASARRAPAIGALRFSR
jgi:hypothetical protein